jgi:hypothetical protein
MIKASEIFLEYVRPLYQETRNYTEAAKLQHILTTPAFVWNAIVLDKDSKRRRGDMPKLIKEQLQTMGTRHRKIFRESLKFWVLRKDTDFAGCDWPLDIEVYKNPHGELIIRAKVLQLNGAPSPNTPAQWL